VKHIGRVLRDEGAPGEREVEHRQLPEDVLEIGAEPTSRWGPRRWWGWMRSRVRARPRLAVVLIVCVTVLVGLSILAVGSLSRDTPTIADTRRHILALDQRVQRDVEHGDTADLDRFLASDFTLVTPNGEPLTRDDYLLALASGALVFNVVEAVPPIRIFTDGDQAVVAYSLKFDVSDGRTTLKHEAWQTTVWEKRRGRWWMIWSQTTATGGFPPPGAND